MLSSSLNILEKSCVGRAAAHQYLSEAASKRTVCVFHIQTSVCFKRVHIENPRSHFYKQTHTHSIFVCAIYTLKNNLKSFSIKKKIKCATWIKHDCAGFSFFSLCVSRTIYGANKFFYTYTIDVCINVALLYDNFVVRRVCVCVFVNG